jgi:hypothetical protein
LGVDANPITITWTAGIGLSALLASAMLLNERTREWSDKKIVASSTVASFSSVILLLFLLGTI